MNDIKKRGSRLRLILSEAHRRKQAGPPQPSLNWRKSLMNRLPVPEALPPRIDQWAFMERLVWRFVPAAGPWL